MRHVQCTLYILATQLNYQRGGRMNKFLEHILYNVHIYCVLLKHLLASVVFRRLNRAETFEQRLSDRPDKEQNMVLLKE